MLLSHVREPFRVYPGSILTPSGLSYKIGTYSVDGLRSRTTCTDHEFICLRAAPSGQGDGEAVVGDDYRGARLVAVYFFDSSALVKRYAYETGSDWIVALTEPSASHSLYIARITAVELVSALSRRQR